MRLAQATRGFLVSAAPVVAIALLQYLLMPFIAAATLGLDTTREPRSLAGLRWLLPRMHAPALVTIAAYWLLAAWLCRPWRRVRSADHLLIAAGLLYGLFHLLGSTMSRHRFATMLCRPLGISERYAWGLDATSPCDDFGAAVAFWMWVGLPLALLVASLVLRVAVSRRGEPGGMR